MPVLSVVMPYYRNPLMLRRQFEVWADEWPDELKLGVEVVLVDDGSPIGERAWQVFHDHGADFLGTMPEVSIYRAKLDTPWHQHGARNLGAHVAAGEWLFMTDMDHMISSSLLVKLLKAAAWYPFATHHTFGRVDLIESTQSTAAWREMPKTRNDSGKPKPHVNSFLLSRTGYWAVGGYDEEFCGIYGTDIEFRRRLGAVLPNVHHHKPPLIRVGRDVIADASTRDVVRKDPERGNLKKEIVRRKSAEGRSNDIRTLAFEWERDL